jgi:hypothetical protein
MGEQIKEMLKLREEKTKVVDIAKQFHLNKHYCSRLLTSAKKGELSWCT